MEGCTPKGIAKILTEEGVSTPGGQTKWYTSTVSSILKNEKYRGSARLQKYFTVDYLTKKKKLNEGEVQQYYIENSHDPIIDPEEWDIVQKEIENRKLLGFTYSSEFGSKLICGDCGTAYGRKVWHSNNEKYRTVVWRCNNKYNQKDSKCKTPTLKEDEIKRRFLIAINQVYENKDLFIQTCRVLRKKLLDTAKNKADLMEAQQELSAVQNLMTGAIKAPTEDNDGLKKIDIEYAALSERYDHILERIQRLEKEDAERRRKASAIQRFVSELERRDQEITKFDKMLWMISLKEAVVDRNGSIRFDFVNGETITL